MSIPTFIALISLLAAGIFSYGMTQSDITTLKRDVNTLTIQSDKMNDKIDRLTTLIYEDRRDKINAR
jgi:hypothetical protein